MTIGPVALDAITDASALHKEGREMHRCVFTRVDDILRGDSAVYQGHVGARRVTVELVQHGDSYELVEARGSCNASLNETERAALHKWVDALRA